MPCHKSTVDAPILQFTNCRILKDHVLQREDLWVRAGKILNPEKVFFDERKPADVQLDCKGSILAPGFIDVQINGGFGVDFSLVTDDVQTGISLVGQKILSSGVTSFCPTMVTSPSSVYHKVLPQIHVQNGGPHGAGVLGVHLEGPFISKEKKGAHPENCLCTFESGAFQNLLAIYGSLDSVRIVTLAPEMKRSGEVIRELTKRGICVSLGLVLVTDAIPAMGLPPGRHTLGQLVVEVEGPNAYIAGTKTLSGSISTMDTCLRHFRDATACSLETALEAASLHPAQLLNIEDQKGTLDYDTDADFVLLDESLHVQATYIAGEEVWRQGNFTI